MSYDRNKAVSYAHTWAFSRNPRFYNFDGIGGDCTNFISQCLYAGCGVMNYTPDVGWFYHSPNSRSAAWSGVEYLHRFLTTNQKIGPYAKEVPLSQIEVGDIIQLSFDGFTFGHSLFVVETGASPQPSNILIATHTYDANHRPLDSYNFTKYRPLHILGARK